MRQRLAAQRTGQSTVWHRTLREAWARPSTVRERNAEQRLTDQQVLMPRTVGTRTTPRSSVSRGSVLMQMPTERIQRQREERP